MRVPENDYTRYLRNYGVDKEASAAGRGASSTSRIFFASIFNENGFCRKRVVTSIAPCRKTVVSGFAENTVSGHGAVDLTPRFLPDPFPLKLLTTKTRQVVAAP